jgi:hypothetical protein
VVVTARFKATTTGTATSVVFNGTVRSLGGQLLGHSDLVRRTKHHVYHEPEVWAQVATGHVQAASWAAPTERMPIST